jgi:hypothetical protein
MAISATYAQIILARIVGQIESGVYTIVSVSQSSAAFGKHNRHTAYLPVMQAKQADMPANAIVQFINASKCQLIEH